MLIELDGIIKRFGRFTALGGVSLAARSGEFLALLGPSGSGKTTLLRLIAGLETPDAGTIRLDGRDVTALHPRDRGIGFVFQHYALFRHMRVFDNIAFGLNVKPRAERPSRTEIRDRVHRLLDLVQLRGLEGRYPGQLSGGQRQRVALARALAVQPRVLLLDEPFGALDAKVRKELRGWLRRLHDEMGLTSVFVTHDQEEALDLADRVVVTRDGMIEQTGAPRVVYEEPASPFVLDFLGPTNRLRCRVRDGHVEIGGFRQPAPEGATQDQDGLVACIRPHDFGVGFPGSTGLPAVVTHVSWGGALLRVTCALDYDGQAVEVDVPRSSDAASALAPGTPVVLKPRAFTLFPLRAFPVE